MWGGGKRVDKLLSIPINATVTPMKTGAQFLKCGGSRNGTIRSQTQPHEPSPDHRIALGPEIFPSHC